VTGVFFCKSSLCSLHNPYNSHPVGKLKWSFKIEKRSIDNYDRKGRNREWHSTACNEHIAKIAALPPVDKKSVFLRSLLALIKCWEAATSAIRRALYVMPGPVSKRQLSD